MTDDEKLDGLLRMSLTEEEIPPPAVQAVLLEQIRRQPAKREISWWLPTLIGGLQTITLVAGVNFIFPNSWLSLLSLPTGACFILCSVTLSAAAQVWTRKERNVYVVDKL
ncbi:hypothetical protein [Paenibacillus brevis]|uniref:Uncharacterized protein n=1 Tax=Paenibacillus brevis TaxID=2841508 RepID=A0ABS6FLY2_9BACL|nr:hypothetical protein [Paenibacillus brevis]MBU5670453.1 hypothetical protein [Paenibacillus brevis]